MTVNYYQLSTEYAKGTLLAYKIPKNLLLLHHYKYTVLYYRKILEGGQELINLVIAFRHNSNLISFPIAEMCLGNFNWGREGVQKRDQL